MATLGETIRMARLRRRLSQEGLGKMLGVTKSTVSTWENDKFAPDGKTLIQLATILDIVEQLFPGYVRINSLPTATTEDDADQAAMRHEIAEMETEKRRIVEQIKAATSDKEAKSLGTKLSELEEKQKELKMVAAMFESMDRKISSLTRHIEASTGKKVQSIVVTGKKEL